MDVAVLLGGRSPEHDVSVASATQVLRHLDRSRWRPWPVRLERDGSWRVARRPLRSGVLFCADDDAFGPPLRPGTALDHLLDACGVEIVLPVLHGPFGEDGTVQGLLELSDVPFVGSGCAASAVAMDKLRTREVYLAAGVPVPRAYEPEGPFALADADEEFRRLEAEVGLPAFVKVDASGSTVGVARVTSAADLRQFLDGFRGRFRRWFAEQAIVGEEITVAVLGNTGERPVALPPVGIYPVDDEWFTHDAKYRPGATEEVVPPRGLSPEAIAEVQALAVRCHERLVCDGMSRTDMIVTSSGPVVLETNTIPGLTEQSLLPRAAAAHGLSFSALLDRLLELGLARAGIAPPVRAAGEVVAAAGARDAANGA